MVGVVGLFVQLDDDDCRDHVEVCPEAGVIATEIADRIARYHGFALIGDYGHTGEKTDTFRVHHSATEIISFVCLIWSQILLDRIANTAYVDEVCCYQPSSMVCRSIGLSD